MRFCTKPTGSVLKESLTTLIYEFWLGSRIVVRRWYDCSVIPVFFTFFCSHALMCTDSFIVWCLCSLLLWSPPKGAAIWEKSTHHLFWSSAKANRRLRWSERVNTLNSFQKLRVFPSNYSTSPRKHCHGTQTPRTMVDTPLIWYSYYFKLKQHYKYGSLHRASTVDFVLHLLLCDHARKKINPLKAVMASERNQNTI